MKNITEKDGITLIAGKIPEEYKLLLSRFSLF